MLQVTPSSTIYMASTHIDFRKGTDGLCAICRNQLAINPLDGAIFLFYNRLKTSITAPVEEDPKMLIWDFCILTS